MKKKYQVVVKLKGDYDLIEELLELLRKHTLGFSSNIMNSDQGDFLAFRTVVEVEK